MNIKYKPYEAKSVPKTGNPEDQRDHTKASLSKYQDKYENSIKAEEVYARPRTSSYLDKVKPLYSEKTLPDYRYKAPSTGFSIKLIPIEQNEEQFSRSNISSKSQKKEKQISKYELELSTDEGIGERKRKLQDKYEMKNHIKELVKLLGEQAVVDEIFRNNKIWFASEGKEDKWEELRK